MAEPSAEQVAEAVSVMRSPDAQLLLETMANVPTESEFPFIATIVRAALAVCPPTGLPAVLSSVDDVARVCEAAGLTRWGAQPTDAVTPIWRGGNHDGVVMFQPGRVLVYHAVLRAVPVIVPMVGWPATALYAAIQAARGGAPS